LLLRQLARAHLDGTTEAARGVYAASPPARRDLKYFAVFHPSDLEAA